MTVKKVLVSRDNAGQQPAFLRMTLGGRALLASWRSRAPWWFGVGGGALLVTIGTLARLAVLEPISAGLAYLTYLPAVVIAALLGGLPAGATVVVLSSLLVPSVFAPLRDLADWLGLIVFLVGGGFIIGVSEVLMRTRAQALAAEETRAIKSHLAAIVESSSDPILSMSLDGTITSWNAAAEHLFGFGAAEIIGQPVATLISPEHHAEEAAIVVQIKKGERIDHFETARRAKSGRVIDVSLSISPIRDNDGDIVGAATIMRDITDRKQAEEKQRESERFFRQVAESLPQLVWTCPADGPCDYLGPQWVRYTGKSEAEQLGYGWLEQVHPDDRERVMAQWRANAATSGNFETEFRIRRYDGAYRWFRTLAVPLRNEAGRVVKWFGSNTDINDIKQAERALRDADRRKDEFLATLAHELRNPLAPIRNGLHILQLDGADGAKAAQVRSMMARQVDHLVRLVDDLLEMSRVSRGRIELRKERIDLAQIVNDAVAASQPQIADLGHDLQILLPSEPLLLEADPTRFAQVLTNLVNNAAKFTRPGGRIEISARREKNDAIVSVRDNGVGIPACKLTCIFDLFTQIDSGLGHSRSGLGIGLALVRSLVEMHGGRVEARSDGLGRGSEFVVRVPLPVSGVADPVGAAIGDALPASRRRVLVVDNDRDVADSFAVLLEILAADVRVAYDGRSALEIVGAFEPELVFLDLGMPKMDGCETARRIRQLHEGRSALLVAMTGWGQEADRRRTQEAGFDKHLVKPAEFSEIQALLALGD